MDNILVDANSLWVINTADALLTLNVESSSGKPTLIRIHKSWAPQDLSVWANRTNILESPDFRRLRSMGYVREMDSEDVKKFFSKNPEAVAENRRVTQSRSTIAQSVPEVIETDNQSTAEDIMVNMIFGDARSEQDVKNAIRGKHSAGQLTESASIQIVNRAKELNMRGVVELIQELNAG